MAEYKAPWSKKLREWWMTHPQATQIAREIITEAAKNSWYYGAVWDWIYHRYYWGYTYPAIYSMWETIDPGIINMYIRVYSKKLLRELEKRGLV
jgi:hypothetical protein